MGCFVDDWDRALRVYLGAFSDPDKCMEEANKKNYKIFGIQDHAECWSGDAMETYDKHGIADNCKDGQGGAWSNSVYFITREFIPYL